MLTNSCFKKLNVFFNFPQKKVMSVSFWSMSEDDDWKKINLKELNAQFTGWVQFSVSMETSVGKYTTINLQ